MDDDEKRALGEQAWALLCSHVTAWLSENIDDLAAVHSDTVRFLRDDLPPLSARVQSLIGIVGVVVEALVSEIAEATGRPADEVWRAVILRREDWS